MKVFPTSRYTMVGTYPDSVTATGHLSANEIDANLHRHKSLTGSLPAFAITAAYSFDTPAFRLPLDQMETMDLRGVVPLVILWPYPPIGLDQINAGELDAVFRERARELYDWSYGGRRPCLMQFGTEITFEHYPWAAANNGGWEMTGWVDGQPWPIGPAKYIHAMRRVWRIFADAGCEITWNWQTMAEFRGNALNRPRWYYPGSECTDWVGISVYRDREGGLWGTYESGLRESLAQIDEIPGAANKPLYVEIMCQEKTGEPNFKADYFRDVFSRTFSGEFERTARHGGAIGVWDAFTAMGEVEVTAGGPRPKLLRTPGITPAPVPLLLGIDSSPAAALAFREGVSGDWYTSRARLV